MSKYRDVGEAVNCDISKNDALPAHFIPCMFPQRVNYGIIVLENFLTEAIFLRKGWAPYYEINVSSDMQNKHVVEHETILY